MKRNSITYKMFVELHARERYFALIICHSNSLRALCVSKMRFLRTCSVPSCWVRKAFFTRSRATNNDSRIRLDSSNSAAVNFLIWFEWSSQPSYVHELQRTSSERMESVTSEFECQLTFWDFASDPF